MTRTALRTGAVAALAALAAFAAIIATDFTTPIGAEPPRSAFPDDESAGRIVARRLADGRVEFSWQARRPRQFYEWSANEGWGERRLPQQRYFPTNARVGRWLRSSPVEVDGAAIGRIEARLLSDGRIEFAFTPSDRERILPPSRYFPTTARVGRWLRSTQITIPQPFRTISAGENHTCAIRAGGEIQCWGANDYGQTDAPDNLYWGGALYGGVSAKSDRTCATSGYPSNAIKCWGRNAYGQNPPDNPGGEQVSAGYEHTCVITNRDPILGHLRIKCWGDNTHGQTDAPEGSEAYHYTSAGGYHTCALRESLAITCWGRDDYGQSGAPAGSYSVVSAGFAHTCAIRAGSGARRTWNGAIECWGNNEHGQTDAPAGSYRAVSAGGRHTCAIRAGSGAIECWGNNEYGQTDAPALY